MAILRAFWGRCLTGEYAGRNMSYFTGFYKFMQVFAGFKILGFIRFKTELGTLKNK